jgi:hypothetical protein
MPDKIGSARRALRHAILDQYIGQSSKTIFDSLKQPDLTVLLFSDLEPLCKTANIPVSTLPGIFASYQIFTKRISEEKFTRYLADEVTCKDPPLVLNPELTKDQINILITLTSSIRNRKTREVATSTVMRGNAGRHAEPEVLSDPMMLSSMWLAMVKYNPMGATENVLRLAALCRYWDTLDLGAPIEEFITAVFLFFRKKLDQLDFQEFAELMESFR